MKIYICNDLGTAYTYTDNELLYAPLSYTSTPSDHIYDTDEFANVEADLVGDEIVTIDGKEITLNELYKRVIGDLTK